MAKTKRVSFRVTDTEKDRIAKAAEDDNRSISAFIRAVILDKIKQKEK